MVKYNNNGISRYGNSREVPNKLSYNGVFRVDSSVWRDVMSWDGGRSGSRAVIVGFHNGNRIVRVSPDNYPLPYHLHINTL